MEPLLSIARPQGNVVEPMDKRDFILLEGVRGDPRASGNLRLLQFVLAEAYVISANYVYYYLSPLTLIGLAAAVRESTLKRKAILYLTEGQTMSTSDLLVQCKTLGLDAGKLFHPSNLGVRFLLEKSFHYFTLNGDATVSGGSREVG